MVLNMDVQAGATRLNRSAASIHLAPPTLLARVAEVLLADPSASLADVARAAGVGRTTLHNHYATRHDLLLAVGHHALDRCGRAVQTAVDDAPTGDPMAALRGVIAGLVPIGAQLSFLFRQPSLDADPEIASRQQVELDRPIGRLMSEATGRRELRSDQPGWWLVSAVYALIYIAWEGVAHGALAPLSAPGLVLDTLLDGVASRSPHSHRGHR